jgi:hypothetical protein
VIPVGHRALVAVERADGRYDCHYSHGGAYEWGLLDSLAAATDGGAPASGDHDEKPSVDPRAVPGVDPAPLATGVSFETVVDTHLDFCTHEACYRVDRDGTESFFVCWFGFPAVETYRSGAGALIGIDAADARADGALVRGWFTGAKGVLAAAVDEGRLTPAEARDRLRVRLRAWAGDRTVVFGPDANGASE